MPVLCLLESGLLSSWGPFGLALLLLVSVHFHSGYCAFLDRQLHEEDVWEIQEFQALEWVGNGASE